MAGLTSPATGCSEAILPMLIEMKMEPASRLETSRFDAAIRAIGSEDAGVAFETDRESGETIIRGASETALDRAIAEMRDRFGVELNIGAPQVCFRETISRQTSIDYTHKKPRPRSEFARIAFALVPLQRGCGVRLSFVRESTPADFLAAARRGANDVLRAGVLAGFPVVDISIDLTDCAWHENDSSAYAFEAAGRNAVRDALLRSGSILLEPIMTVSVRCPHESAAVVAADLKRRRATGVEQDNRDDLRITGAFVPLANMFGYESSLRSMTGGAGSHDLRFHAYAAAPDSFDDDPFRPAMAMRA